MTTDEVVVLHVLVSQSQEVAGHEVQPSTYFGWLERRSPSRRLKQRVGEVDANDMVTETGQCDRLGPRPQPASNTRSGSPLARRLTAS